MNSIKNVYGFINNFVIFYDFVKFKKHFKVQKQLLHFQKYIAVLYAALLLVELQSLNLMIHEAY